VKELGNRLLFFTFVWAVFSSMIVAGCGFIWFVISFADWRIADMEWSIVRLFIAIAGGIAACIAVTEDDL